MKPKRLVLGGAGHAHLHVLQRADELANRGYEITLVAPDRFWYSGLATGMLGGTYAAEEDQIDVATLAARHRVGFLDRRIRRIDAAAQVVWLDGGSSLRYDVLSLNLGSQPPPLPGGEGHERVYPAKPIANLWRLRRDLSARLALSGDDPVRVVVVGGGTTGCELAANLSGLVRRCGGRAELTLVSSGESILRQWPAGAAAAVAAGLQRRGVCLRARRRVCRIGPCMAGLDDGSELPFDMLVNATGLAPSPVIAGSGLAVSRDGALLVDRRLRAVGGYEIYGAGDCAAIEDLELPKVGVYAVREAPVLFGNLSAALEGAPLHDFEPQRRFLLIMNLGDGTGLAARNGLWWRGRAALWLKDWIDRRFLDQYREA
jgi:NADH dehydrogenase FAD-containing subunit